MCPARQRKSLAGLNNVAADGTDSFDVLLQIPKKVISKYPNRKEDMEKLENRLTQGKRYLKGDYKTNCKHFTSEIADHCRALALSDPKLEEFQHKCDHQHSQSCMHCDDLKGVLDDFRQLDLEGFDKKEKEILQYDIQEACSRIEAWKAHILTVIHQDAHKYEVLRKLTEDTAFVIIDFAMKFLSRRY